MRRSVSTVQRWARSEDLPVHRDPRDHGNVFAYRDELDHWWASRLQQLPHEEPATDAVCAPGLESRAGTSERVAQGQGRPRFVSRTLWAVAGGLLVAVSALSVAVMSPRRPSGTHAPPGSPVVRQMTATPEMEWRADVAPGGTEIAYAAWSQVGTEIWIKPVDDRPARRLLVLQPGNVGGQGYPTWSPDGQWIAYLQEVDRETRQVRLIPAAGGPSRAVTLIKGVSLAWTRDGEALVVADRPAQGDPFSLFLVARDGTRVRRLTMPPQDAIGDLWVSASPDGRSLAFARYTTWAEADVYVVGVDGAEARRVTFDEHPIEGLAWMPEGRSVVVSWAREGMSRLWEVPVDGAPDQAPSLLAAPDRGAKLPSAVQGPKGAVRIAYVRSINDANIWRLDVGGASSTRRTVAPSTYYEDYPAVSPDGRRLAFASNRTGATEVWIAELDGSNPTQITFRNGPLCMAPQWSPDGRRLAFGSITGTNRDIFVVGLDGAAPLRLTSEPSEEVNPSWSRDGRWIYFSSNRSGVDQIWRLPSAGGRPSRVTGGAATEAHESPDGTRLLFVRGRDTDGLWSVPTGGGQERLEIEGVREGLWAVSRQGVLFATRPGQELGVHYVVRLWDPATHRVRDVADLATPHLYPGFAATPDGRTVFWTRNDGRGTDVFVMDLERSR